MKKNGSFIILCVKNFYLTICYVFTAKMLVLKVYFCTFNYRTRELQLKKEYFD